VSQETLAEMVGTTRSRVNFFMKKFQRLGFIDYKDGLKVNNSLLTVVLHDRRQIKLHPSSWRCLDRPWSGGARHQGDKSTSRRFVDIRGQDPRSSPTDIIGLPAATS
jgi:hypothetical protein